MASIDSIEQIMASSDSTEVPPSSLCETPTIINSTKTKSKCSIRQVLSDFKAKFCVSKPKSLQKNHREAASSSATTHQNDNHSGAISFCCKMISSDLLLVDSALKKHVDRMNVQINQAREKFEELQSLGGSQRDFDELRKSVSKLKLQIPSHVKIRSADSNPHCNRWPNIKKTEDGMTHFFYEEPKFERTGDVDGRILEAYRELPMEFRRSLLCFFKFPPEAIIKRTMLIYLWIGQGYTLSYYGDNEIFED